MFSLAQVCFDGKSAEECKSRWAYIEQKLRRFRTLSELTDDALKWTEYRWYNFNNRVILERNITQQLQFVLNNIFLHLLLYSLRKIKNLPTSLNSLPPPSTFSCTRKMKKSS